MLVYSYPFYDLPDRRRFPPPGWRMLEHYKTERTRTTLGYATTQSWRTRDPRIADRHHSSLAPCSRRSTNRHSSLVIQSSSPCANTPISITSTNEGNRYDRLTSLNDDATALRLIREIERTTGWIVDFESPTGFAAPFDDMRTLQHARDRFKDDNPSGYFRLCHIIAQIEEGSDGIDPQDWFP